VIRILILCGLSLAVAGAAAQKDKDEKPAAKIYKTPQECFDDAAAAMVKKDRTAMLACFTPEAHKQMAADMAVQGISMRAEMTGKSAKDKDKAEKDEALLKKYKQLFDVLDKHGLTEAATKDLKVKDFRPTKQNREAVVKLVKDPAAFAAAFLTALDKFGEGAPRDEPKPTLTGVKIDGDKASGTVVVKFKVKAKDKDTEDVRERKQPLTFSKVNGGWLIDPEQDEVKERPKEGSKEKKDK